MDQLKKSRCRRDALGRALAGSQLQVQLYVNRRRPELDASILDALGLTARSPVAIHWASPLEERGFAEHMDGAFLKRLGLSRFTKDLAEFWPRSGPRWDGLVSLRDVEADEAFG